MSAFAGGIWFLAPIESSAQAVGCQLAQNQPPQPLELNSVGAGTLAKTVAQEKEIYECRDASGLTAVVDLETFIEFVETDNGTNVSTLSRRVETATCRKSIQGPVGCGSSTVALGAAAPLPAQCTPQGVPQPADPVVMNTVAFGSSNRSVKTIKVDKEVRVCPDQTILDIYLFTEIIEAKTTTGTITYQPVARRFEGIACRKSPTSATNPTIQSCKRIQIGTL